ncbi:hypothetical protein B7463_g5098, partial [Scytalidium lignicola]
MATPDITSVCVAPLSPNYLLLHRYVFYVSLILPLINPFHTSSSSLTYPPPTVPPLIKAAYAYALTYSGTASLYAILLLSSPSNLQSLPINLDIFGVWAVLSASACVLLAFLEWDKVLQQPHRGQQRVRPIFTIWGVWITVGVICVFVALVKAKPAVANGDFGAVIAQSDCVAMAMEQRLRFRLRVAEDVVVSDYDRIFGKLYDHLKHIGAPMMFIVLFYGLIPCLFTIASAKPDCKGERTSYECYSDGNGEFSILSSICRGYILARRVALVCVPVVLITNVVFNEIYLLKGWEGGDGIPEAEKMYEVGQWGLLVGMSLVTAAAVINWAFGRMWKEVKDSGIIV